MRKLSLSPWMKYTACLGALLLSGCATYHPLPLPAAPDLSKAPDLAAPPGQFGLPALPPHLVPQNGLDEISVATLAVFNDPDLKAARLQAGVAGAQLLQAGLLPDPRISAGYASSALNYGGAIGLSEDIQALITLGAAKAAARAGQKQVNLNILWQEWQVAEKARELFIQARADSQIQGVLKAMDNLLAGSYHRDQAALERGDATSATVAADLTVLTNAETSLHQTRLDANLTRHTLNQLLGLQPDVQLRLIGPSEIVPLRQDEFQAALSALAHRRVDLLALQAGYQSQEEDLRRAILAQFPSVSAGVEQSRDPVEGVNSFGLNVDLTLPVFNRNRGQIALQRATRSLLRQTYQAQLDLARGQADQVWEATKIMERQLRDLDARLPLLENTAAAAKQNLEQDNLDADLYVTLQSNSLTKQVEAIQLRASLYKARSALDTLLGLPFGAP